MNLPTEGRLAITRHEGQEIVIGPGATRPISLIVTQADNGKATLAIAAEKGVAIHRREVWDRLQAATCDVAAETEEYPRPPELRSTIAAAGVPAEAVPLMGDSNHPSVVQVAMRSWPDMREVYGQDNANAPSAASLPPASGPKLYRGHRCGTISPSVWIEQAGVQSVLVSAVPIPAVFNWGVPGIGSLELATAILADATGSMMLAKLHAHAYRTEVIGLLPMHEFTLPETDVLAWIDSRTRAGGAAHAAHAACEG